MKNKLKEYIPYEEEERKRIWNEGVFVLDANVLLNLCRYSKQSSDELLAIVKNHREDIWLPYQVAMEFFNNRINVIEGIKGEFDKLLANVSKIDSILGTGLKFQEFRSDTALNIDQLRKDIKSFRARTETKVKKWKREFEENDKDVILEEILALYDGKVGDDYPTDKLETLYKEGEDRYKQNTPPGYADGTEKEKKGKRHKFGDLIWWKQAIDYAKANKRDLILVTDDKKEDWWYKVAGKTKSPRVELIREFEKETEGHKFLMYKTHQFMEMAKELDGAQVSDSSIREAEETGAVNYSQLMELMGRGSSPLGVDLQPYVVGGYNYNPNQALGSYINGQDGISPLTGSRFVNGYFSPFQQPVADGNVLGADLLQFFAEHPDGMMTMPKIDDEQSRKWIEGIINKNKTK